MSAAESTPEEAGKAATSDDAAVTAGRGVVFIGAAKIWFMLAGFATEIGLANLVARATYGAYGFVAQSISIVNNVVVTGTIQAVSRFTTAEPHAAAKVRATGLRMHLVVGLPIAILFAVLAPVTARLVHDPSKAGPLALSAGIACGYAFYAVLVGSANGTRQFHKQAGLDVTFSTLKAALVVGGAAAGLGVHGAVGGWVAAVAVILVVAATWVGWTAGARGGAVKPMIVYLGGLALYQLIINGIMAADQLLLKRLVTEWFVAHATPDPARAADTQVGYYRAVQQLARLPYQLMIAVTFVVFPLVSRATFENDREKTASYIRTTLRYSLMFAVAMGVVFAANPSELLDVPFQPDFAALGGPALAALALGHVAFAVFTISGAILNGAGHTRDAVLVAGATLASLIAGLWLAIPRFEPGRDVLFACGAATGGAMMVGALVSGVLLVRRFGAFVPAASAVRVLLAAAAAIAVGRVVPARSTPIVLAEAIVVGLVYLVTLVATRELGRADLQAVVRIARRRRS